MLHTYACGIAVYCFYIATAVYCQLRRGVQLYMYVARCTAVLIPFHSAGLNKKAV